MRAPYAKDWGTKKMGSGATALAPFYHFSGTKKRIRQYLAGMNQTHKRVKKYLI
jgi:hypothetical protein